MDINCSYYNPTEIGTPPSTTTQYASSSCVMPDLASSTNGFTHGEIINGIFLFLILMILGFDLLLKMLYPKK